MNYVLRTMFPVRRDRTPDETDIVSLKQSLERLGQYDSPNWQKATDYDENLFKGIEAFQRNRGLKVDGVVNPKGPTAEAIGAELGLRSPLVMEKDPRPVQGIREATTFPLSISADARASNQRSVKAIGHTGKFGLLPGLAATAWQKGDAGKAEVIDLFHQLHGADEADARNLEARFLPMIPRDDHGLFRELRARKQTNGLTAHSIRNRTNIEVSQLSPAKPGTTTSQPPFPMTLPLGDPKNPPKIRNDKIGHGHFHDPRKDKNNKPYQHQGVDIQGSPGDEIRSPVNGTIERIGDPYGTGQLSIVWIRSDHGEKVGL